MPSEYRGHQAFTKFKDLPTFLKSHVELEGMQGQMIRVPGEKATEAEIAEYHTKQGWPGGADKYEVKFGEGVPVDEKLLNGFLAKANELHLPKGTAQALAGWWAEQASAAMEGSQASHAANNAKYAEELKKEWGYAYERNYQLAARGLAKILGVGHGDKVIEHPMFKALQAAGVTDHPDFIKAIHAFALANGEDEYIDAQNPPSAEDLQTATEEYNATMNADRKTHPYWNGQAQGHKEAVERMKYLREVMIAGKAQG